MIAIVAQSGYNEPVSKTTKIIIACTMCLGVAAIVIALLQWFGVIG